MRRFACVFLVLAAGCDDGGAVDGGATDGGAVDAGALDAGALDAGALDAGATAGPCLAFGSPAAVGDVADPDLNEISGIAASRAHPGALYVHNDSGDGPRVYVLDAADASVRGTITLDGASARDWEDVAVGPGADGAPWVFAGDVGDNAARDGRGTPRASVFVHRFPEAAVDGFGAFGAAMVTPETVELVYPDRPHDCESIAMAPNGDLYLLSKEDAGVSTLFVARAPFDGTVTLEVVTTIDVGGALVPGGRQTTAMDLSPGGGALLVRTYNRIHLFARETGEDWAAALARASVTVRPAVEVQGEAIGWRADGRAFFTISEGASPTLSRYEATTPGCVAP